MYTIHLKELVPIEVLNDLLEQYHDITSMASSVVDFRGKTITRNNFHPVCKLIRSLPELEKLCIQSDAYAGLTASISKEPYVYQCPCGLIDCAVPIFVADTCVGQIMTGQVMLENADMDLVPKISDYLPRSFDKLKTIHYLEQYQDNISILSYKEINTYTKLLKIIAQLISNMGMANIVNNEHKEQEIKMLEGKQQIVETEAAMARLKLQLLENQLPSNFLYESLNSIYQLAIIEKAEKTSDLIFSVSSVLKRSLDSKEALIPLKKEINYIQDYINIRNISRYYKISIIENIPEECANKLIPIALLQSVLDYVFIEQIENVNDKSAIHIRAFYENETLILELFSPQVVLRIFDLKELKKDRLNNNTDLSQKSRLALKNLLNVLNLYYGISYDIKTVPTEDGKGKMVISLFSKEIS